MNKKEEKNIDQELDIELGKLQNSKESAIVKCRYFSFAKYCYWLLYTYREKDNIFLVKDLMRYSHIAYSTAFHFLRNLVDLGYLEKTKLSNNVTEFCLIENGGHMKLFELLPYIKKTLKDKVKTD